MTPGFLVRPATIEDAATVADIYVTSSNAAFRAWQPPVYVTDRRIERWAADLVKPGYHWWVAEVGSEAVGVGGVGPSRDPVGEEIGELDTLAIFPHHWRRGIGTALMARATEQLDRDGYERSVLWTWTDYPPAAGFYRATGWDRSDRHRDHGRQVSYWRSAGRGRGRRSGPLRPPADLGPSGEE